ncbi:MAG: hypothetical protein MJZ12_06160 [Prevotella sp.]|nr:hypothetical protein [Prevotella sp.]
MGWIGAAIGAAGSIFGGIKASEAMKEVADNIRQQQQANQAWYDRNYNENPLMRAGAQALLQRTDEAIKRRNRQAAGAQAVMGGTDESVAAAKEAGAREEAEVTRQILAADDARKDRIENQYMQTKATLDAQMNDLRKQKANAISGAIQGAIQGGVSMPF